MASHQSLKGTTQNTFLIGKEGTHTNPIADNHAATKKFVEDNFESRIVETSDRQIYCATTGNDTTGDGSIGTPFRTVEHALSTVGNYFDNVTITIYCDKETYTWTSDLVLDFKGSGNLLFKYNGGIEEGFDVQETGTVTSNDDIFRHTDSSKSWTNDAEKGKFIYITSVGSGTLPFEWENNHFGILPISWNDANSFDMPRNSFSSDDIANYSILTHGIVFDLGANDFIITADTTINIKFAGIDIQGTNFKSSEDNANCLSTSNFNNCKLVFTGTDFNAFGATIYNTFVQNTPCLYNPYDVTSSSIDSANSQPLILGSYPGFNFFYSTIRKTGSKANTYGITTSKTYLSLMDAKFYNFDDCVSLIESTTVSGSFDFVDCDCFIRTKAGKVVSSGITFLSEPSVARLTTDGTVEATNYIDLETGLDCLSVAPVAKQFVYSPYDINIATGQEYKINDVSINTGGTLSNVAYLDQANTFTAAQDISDGNIVLKLGADSGANTRTNETAKYARIGAAHYTNAEEPAAMIYCVSGVTANNLYLGGGTNSLNAATDIRFHTAADGTTTNGTERARIDSAGNFGLGTASPDAEALSTFLHIANESNNLAGINITGGDGSDEAAIGTIDFSDPGNTDERLAMIAGRVNGSSATPGGDLEFWTQPDSGALTKRMTVAAGGNVGIGTDTPDVELDIIGSVNINGIGTSLKVQRPITSATPMVLFNAVTGGSGRSLFQITTTDNFVDRYLARFSGNSGSSEIVISSNGRVGIGVTSPDDILEISDNANSATRGSISFNTVSNRKLDISSEGTFNSYNTNNGPSGFSTGGFTFNVSNTTALKIDSDGKIGINESSPDALLHITGSDPQVYIENTDAGDTALSNDIAGVFLTMGSSVSTSKYTPGVKFGSTDSALTTANPKYLAGIHGYATESYNADDDGGMGLEFFTSPNAPGAASVPVSRMVIDNDGKVGINEPDPETLIHISGTSAVSIMLEDTSATVDSKKFRLYTDSDFGYIDAPNDAFDASLSLMSFNLINGHAGIGTESPSEKLHVQDSTADVRIRLQGTNAGGANTLGFELNNEGDFKGGMFYIEATNTTSLWGQSGTIPPIVFDSSGAIGTHNETAPDVDPGGICINHGANDGNAFTIKNSDVAHGITDVDETDTYLAIRKASAGSGGAMFRSYSEGTIATEYQSNATTEDTTNTTSSNANYFVNARLKSGTTVGAHAAGANIVGFYNSGTAAQLFKANGDIYTNTDQTSGLAGTFDSEDDIMLARAAQLEVKGYKEHNLKKYANRLQELGIMEGSFLSHRKITDLQLGAIGQLFNVIKGLAKKLNITEEELLLMSKEY